MEIKIFGKFFELLGDISISADILHNADKSKLFLESDAMGTDGIYKIIWRFDRYDQNGDDIDLDCYDYEDESKIEIIKII